MGASLPILLCCALAGVGLWLNVPLHSHRRTRAVGYSVLLLALLMLAALFLSPAGPDASGGRSPIITVVFAILAGASLAAAVVTIGSHSPSHSAAGYAVMLLADAGVLLLNRAAALAVVMLLIAGGTGAAIMILRRAIERSAREVSPEAPPREPWLVCLTAVVLAAVLIGAFQTVAATEVGRISGTDQRPALPDPAVVRSTLQRPADHLHQTRERTSAPLREHALTASVFFALALVAAAGTMLLCSRAHPPRKGSSATGTNIPP